MTDESGSCSVRQIPLSQGRVALVDESDYERASKFSWYADKSVDGKRWYARRNLFNEKTGKRTTQLLHKFIIGSCGKMDIDHRDGDGLNCQRSNLRVATRSQNNFNSGKNINNKSGFKGVHFNKANNNWRAQIKVNGKRIHIGCFCSAEEAAKAYDISARSLCGEFAKLNFDNRES